jgi:hypothetical protein
VKYLAAIIGLFLFGATARPASPYAGEYLVVWRSYSPLSPGAVLEGGADVTIARDGTLTGQGAYFDRTAINLAGKVKDSGEAAVVEDDAGFIATFILRLTYSAFFEGPHRFSAIFPDGRVITGVRIERAQPATGVYHVQTKSGDDAFILVERDGAVRAAKYDFDDNKIELNGFVTGDTFEAEAPNGEKLTGRFDGKKISGRYSDGDGTGSAFDGEKY